MERTRTRRMGTPVAGQSTAGLASQASAQPAQMCLGIARLVVSVRSTRERLSFPFERHRNTAVRVAITKLGFTKRSVRDSRSLGTKRMQQLGADAHGNVQTEARRLRVQSRSCQIHRCGVREIAASGPRLVVYPSPRWWQPAESSPRTFVTDLGDTTIESQYRHRSESTGRDAAADERNETTKRRRRHQSPNASPAAAMRRRPMSHTAQCPVTERLKGTSL